MILLATLVVGLCLSSFWAYDEWKNHTKGNTIKKILSLVLAINFGIAVCVTVFLLWRSKSRSLFLSDSDFVTTLPKFHHAVKRDDVDQVWHMLQRHPEKVNEPVAYLRARGVTPIQLANSIEMIRILIHHGADVNRVENMDGMEINHVFSNILINLMDKNHWHELPDTDVEALREFLDNPALDRSKIVLYKIPSLKVWELLLEYDDIPVTTETFRTFLEEWHWDEEWSEQKKEQVKRCLSRILDRTDVDMPNKWGDTAVMIAPPKLVEWLINEKGASLDPEYTNNYGETIVDRT